MPTDTIQIIGIDPGSRITGYGIIHAHGSTLQFVTCGHIRSSATDFSTRLHHIWFELNQVLQQHQPQEAAIEEVFTCRNMQSALKLGQARGAALVAIAQHTLPVREYSARLVKKTVVGYGAAEKTQVQHMVRALLRLTATPPADAADALAIAICHAHHRQLALRLMEGTHS